MFNDLYGYCCDDPVNFNDPTGMVMFGGLLTVPAFLAAARAVPMVARAARTYVPKALKVLRGHGKQATKAVEQAGKYVGQKAPELWDKAQKTAGNMYNQAKAEMPSLAGKTTKAWDKAAKVGDKGLKQANAQVGRYAEGLNKAGDFVAGKAAPHAEKINLGTQVVDGVFGKLGPGNTLISQVTGVANEVRENGEDSLEMVKNEKWSEKEQKKISDKPSSGGWRGR